MRRIWFYLVISLMLAGCGTQGQSKIATFESADLANKVVVMLNKHQIPSTLSVQKEWYSVSVDESNEMKARELLTTFNFYFEKEDLNDLLESKFASLSKLEQVKSNFLQSREISNKLSVMPNIFRVSVVVTGSQKKRISVLILSLSELDSENKANIEQFLKGTLESEDKLTVSYFVQAS
ncbi:type III secretion protein [Vibrio parahaemolyticus]|uniref:Type III secretion protein n=2 Tax=Vibrio parahaemolyticus TaxID=670 RepID=A0AAX0MIY3_VIBPH|nr:type III secretion protein [Vibrio parahaemolyticus]OQS99845.1 type III secretion protein [Vibrio parahaemolyticus O4:K12 str. K1203]ANQ59294.1 type III secretion protein [Vibrio parahaemolyticus]EGQ7712325.1 type III secretion protein [Vibrio parahaemolyticus]EGQ7716599.1 type III secretion protein [Vibrio parahaemolyticus]EGQ7722187.1 type III secretion protein [Vibrio parahaemolyticus]